MPASQKSLVLTNAYRQHLLAIGDRVEREARRRWPRIEELDATDWPERMAAELTVAQRQAIRLTAGYIAAFLRSEGARGTVPAIDLSSVGKSRDGRPLSDALLSPIIGVRAALKQGKTPEQALALGLVRATRTTKFEAVQTARDALTDTVSVDDRFSGWQRNVSGTCAACMALSGTSGPRFEVHPGCECVPMPSVKGAVNRFPLPTGAAHFKSLSKEEQASKIGPEAAELIREDKADLKDFVSHSEQAEQPNFITQRPVEDVTTS